MAVSLVARSLHATDVPHTDVYNTSPRRNFTAYSLGGPCAPSFCTRAPKCKKYGFVHRLTVFCELIVTHSRYRSIAPVRMYNAPPAVGGPVLGVTALSASTPTTQSVSVDSFHYESDFIDVTYELTLLASLQGVACNLLHMCCRLKRHLTEVQTTKLNVDMTSEVAASSGRESYHLHCIQIMSAHTAKLQAENTELTGRVSSSAF